MQALTAGRAGHDGVPAPVPQRGRGVAGTGSVAAVLFACLFAAQSGQLALTPVLAAAADDLDVSTSAAGQLRTLAAVVAAAAALAVDPLVARVQLRTLLRSGLALLAAGAALSALAQGFLQLATGQAIAGAASSVLVATGVSAAASWTDEANRGRVVAWALAGAPAAWVAAMPVIGIVGGIEWRLAFVVAIVSAAAASAVLQRAPASSPRASGESFRSLLAAPGVRTWALSEALAYSAWSGVLVYAGALFVESYGTSVSRVGWCLGLGAAAYIPGTFLAHRIPAAWARPALATASLSLAMCVIPFGGLRLSTVVSAVAFGVLCFLAGVRTFLGSVAGLDLAGKRPAAAMSLRTAAAQTGSIVGAGVGGLALSLGGYPALAIMLAALFATAGSLHVSRPGAFTRRGRGHATRRALPRLAAARTRAR